MTNQDFDTGSHPPSPATRFPSSAAMSAPSSSAAASAGGPSSPMPIAGGFPSSFNERSPSFSDHYRTDSAVQQPPHSRQSPHSQAQSSPSNNKPIPIERPQRRASLLDWAVQAFSPPSHHTNNTWSFSHANANSNSPGNETSDGVLGQPSTNANTNTGLNDPSSLSRSLPQQTSVLDQVMGHHSPSNPTSPSTFDRMSASPSDPSSPSHHGHPHPRRRPRAFSQSAMMASMLTHDEALNLSRSGSTKGPGTKTQDPHAKPRSSRYDSMGLIAAYSGGPGSF